MFADNAVVMKSLAPFFDGANCFNLPVPTMEYYDLTEFIKKYEALNPITGMEALGKLQKALEDVQVYLGSLVQQFNSCSSTILRIKQLFGIPMSEPVDTVGFVARTSTSGVSLKFEINIIDPSNFSEIEEAAKGVLSFYQFFSLSPEIWDVSKQGSELALNSLKSAKKVGKEGLANSSVIGKIGWNSGVHTWKLHVYGEAGATTPLLIHYIVIGVATEINQENICHVPGKTFGLCTYQNAKLYNLGEIFSDYKTIPPNTIVTLVLDCDNGTLAFSIPVHGEILRIRVPTKQMLYPWACLYAKENSVSFIYQ